MFDFKMTYTSLYRKVGAIFNIYNFFSLSGMGIKVFHIIPDKISAKCDT